MTKIRLAIVDKSKQLCQKIEQYMLNNYYEDFEVVGIAFDGNGALEIVERRQPDVLLLDLVLPQIDGLGVLQMLKKNEGTKHIICIIMTEIKMSLF